MNLSKTAIEALAASIGAHMREEGWSQQELAARAKVSQSQVSRAIAGSFKKRNASIIQICITLGMDVGNVSAPRSSDDREKIERCATDLWDGTRVDADRIVTLLRQIAALRRS
jgi:transcriptional regulator with XRE-family HTH domain